MTTLEQTSRGGFGLPATLTAAPGGLRFRQPWFPGWRRLVGTAGPGVLVAAGYIDPRHWATDLGGGSRYGYALLSMVFIANLIAMVVQALCVRLAIATGKSLAEYSREAYSRPVVLTLWLSAEIAMVMTDLAELVGGAIALKLLFGIGLIPGVLLMSGGTLVFLMIGRDDWRWLRGLVCVLLLIVAASFVSLLWLGIIGATVMPHNLYLHSGLLAPAGRALERREKRSAIKENVRDSNTS